VEAPLSLELRYAPSSAVQQTVDLSGAATVMIGSLPSNQIAIAAPGVEPIHCLVERRDDGRWFVTDLGTLTGVKLNGQRVKVEAPVGPGDVIEVGAAKIEVQALIAAATPGTAEL
jgi:pSer/pThr/pTyr-binding forkhead associated (FHA) protein